MAEKTKCLIIQLRPKFQELRDARTYTEKQVKDIMFSFARELVDEMTDEELHTLIESVFDFD